MVETAVLIETSQIADWVSFELIRFLPCSSTTTHN